RLSRPYLLPQPALCPPGDRARQDPRCRGRASCADIRSAPALCRGTQQLSSDILHAGGCLGVVRQLWTGAARYRETREIMKTKITLKDPDLRGSLIALRRAARAARRRSLAMGTPFYVMKAG